MDIPIPISPKSAQLAILEALRVATETENRLAELSGRFLGRLREFRSALITAAVTGQIDIGAWCKRGETERRLETIEVRQLAPGAKRQQQAVTA